MFNFFIRKTFLRGLSKEEQEMCMLLRQRTKTDLIADLLIITLFTLPLASLIASLFFCYESISTLIQICVLSLAYLIFIIWFMKKFKEPIKTFRKLLSNNMYLKYVVNGDAISHDDFDVIKKKNKDLHEFIMTQQVYGYCYGICFEILKALKNGSMFFIAVKALESEKAENGNKNYTMHVLYVKNDWCFDTYSQRQLPLEEALKAFHAKTYKSFSYKDLEGKSYYEFRTENYSALKLWCEENDCYQEWLNDD